MTDEREMVTDLIHAHTPSSTHLGEKTVQEPSGRGQVLRNPRADFHRQGAASLSLLAF